MVNVLIIEDEQPAAQRLERLLHEIAPDFRVVQQCDSIETSVNYLRSASPPDLILLDVQLGDGLSFEIFSKTAVSCPVIFTTAYDEYAIKAFELNSIDYLLKPINKIKLEKSLEKFRRISSQIVENNWQILSNLLEKEKQSYKQRFLVYAGEHLHTIQTEDIAYFYSVEKATFIATKSGKNFDIDFSLDKLEILLNPTDFFRINRQFLISFSSIKKIVLLSKSRIKLVLDPLPTQETLISNARTHEFREWLDR